MEVTEVMEWWTDGAVECWGVEWEELREVSGEGASGLPLTAYCLPRSA